jgi:excisionase family DNA binding protein
MPPKDNPPPGVDITGSIIIPKFQQQSITIGPYAAESDPQPSIADAISKISEHVTARVEERVIEHLEHMAPPVKPALLTVKDAAAYLGRSEQSIQHLIFTKELPVVRVGRRVHLDRRDLDLWIEKNKY